jgi:positive regulator of sigma E activity
MHVTTACLLTPEETSILKNETSTILYRPDTRTIFLITILEENLKSQEDRNICGSGRMKGVSYLIVLAFFSA